MLPDGYILKLIRKYNKRLLYWAIALTVLSIFPLLHSSGRPEATARWDYLVISIFIMIALNSLVRNLIWNSKPVLHPICKYLRRYGDLEDLIAEIDREAETAAESTICVTGSWIIHQGFLRFGLIPLSDVVWFYSREPKQKQKQVKSNLLVVHTKDKKAHLIRYKPGMKGGKPEAAISRRAPWAYAGYSEKTAELWKKNRREMVDDVLKKAEKFTTVVKN